MQLIIHTMDLIGSSKSPNFSAPMSGDPVTAYDSLGNLYYENMYNSGGNIIGCKVIKSTDNGATWSPSVTAIAGNDKNWIAADQTAVLMQIMFILL